MPKTPTLKDALSQEFKELSAQAVQLKHTIDEAKTNLKKQLYTKKLEKINKRVYAIMLELTILQAREKKVKPKITIVDAPDED
jgi:hypothetical protein